LVIVISSSVVSGAVAGQTIDANGGALGAGYVSSTGGAGGSNGTAILLPDTRGVNSSFASGIQTAPVSSNTATTAFGATLTLGTAIQNTTGYDLLVNVSVPVTAATAATFIGGVGPTSTPTTNTLSPSLTISAVTDYFTFCFVVPSSYYLLVNTSGTISAGTPVVVATPL
jgi:hypothetical protein